MFDGIKRLFKGKKDGIEPKTEPKTEKDAIVKNNLDVFKTPEGQGRWCLVVGAEGQGKTHLVREIAKKVNDFGYVDATEFQTVENVQLFVIDDLHKAEPSKQEEIFNFLCGARHQNIKNIICITQELKGIPSEVLRRFKVIAFFYSAKQHMKLQTLIEGGLREASAMSDKIIRLMPRRYCLYDVQSGYFKNPPLSNVETDLLLKAMQDVIPIVEQKDTLEKYGKITVNGEKLDRTDIKITPLIVKALKEHPEFKYSKIAEDHKTTVQVVKNVAYRYRKGLLKYD